MVHIYSIECIEGIFCCKPHRLTSNRSVLHVNSNSAASTVLSRQTPQNEPVSSARRFNAGYIFPAGFKSRLLFRSSINLDAMCIHECEIIGHGGTCWPAPTFCVTALDRPDEPLAGKSATSCWTQVWR